MSSAVPEPSLEAVAWPHIESFNTVYQGGLAKILQYLPPLALSQQDLLEAGKPAPHFASLKLSFDRLRIGKPFRTNDFAAKVQEVYPQECRLAGTTYSGALLYEATLEVDGVAQHFTGSLGEVPLMVRSSHCHLAGLTRSQLVDAGEDPNECGGYFIVNGKEKMLRLVQVAKRNYPLGFLRPSYCARAPGFTQFAVQMRCVREDCYSRTLTLHYVADGSVCLRLLIRKQEFLLPLAQVLHGLADCSHRDVFLRLAAHCPARAAKVEVMLRCAPHATRRLCLEHLGACFRGLLAVEHSYSNYQAGQIFLAEHVLVHLSDAWAKFETLCLMADKLYCLAEGRVAPENLDVLSSQELLLPGHLYLMLLREKLEETLAFVKRKLLKDAAGKRPRDPSKSELSAESLRRTLAMAAAGKGLELLLATGDLRSKSGLDLLQDKGLSVLADRLNNLRFLSHFRSVHRGAYFAKMKTTAVRKLMPESWGFLCPVHTPDGAPCGLLNHLTLHCRPLPKDALDAARQPLAQVCSDLGMLSPTLRPSLQHCYAVLVDGAVCGFVEDGRCAVFVQALRRLKVRGETLPDQTEVAWFPKSAYSNQAYPLVSLTTAPARFQRPVLNVREGRVEWVSPLEQLVMDIGEAGEAYRELGVGGLFSVLPQQIPFMNHNQSPRNMYQCQMAKQSMGAGCLNWHLRFDKKLYRLLNTQLPLLRSPLHRPMAFGDYGSGVNAVVAVLSYTGYDMEDGMIINKASYEAGFGHGLAYKTVELELTRGATGSARFKLLRDAPLPLRRSFDLPGHFGSDGLCKVGCRLTKFSPIAALYDPTRHSIRTIANKESEPCVVESLYVVSGTEAVERVVLKLRFDRRPVIGDKFSSRHGQKGVLSMLWPKEDLPFTESGVTPDVIINPNAFPSRMTIGMLLESLAGKACCLEGTSYLHRSFENTAPPADGLAPTAHEDSKDMARYFGGQLLRRGFNLHGNELLYNGARGTPLYADIFMGVVFYQRLRHMVHDKSQARATGPVDALTMQPLKGRKRGGGIRVGEMERDALLAHGLSLSIQDRLFESSDRSLGFVCRSCGQILSAFRRIQKISGDMLDEVFEEEVVCKACSAKACSKVSLPFVFRLLAHELAAVGIGMRFSLKE